ncbi:MAG: sugar ABC transporter ATP-binding protein [Actinomycetota bacterium]|nr:sugar ABC transporter ATP-binding protein [Actinomycetota bacterium]
MKAPLTGQNKSKASSGSDAAPHDTAEALDNGSVVAVRGISKSYPGVQALKSVDLDVYPGTVHAISGENGAGKSTLGKVIAGLVSPDAGTIYVEQRAVHIDSPATARHLGISAVPQELSLIPNMTVAENVNVAALPNRRGLLSQRELYARTGALLDSLGLQIAPSSRLGDHSPGIQQLVMIGRAFVQKAKVVILDEPTAALTEPEVEHLFSVVRTAQEAGTAFIFVSHRFEDLSQIADTVTVLRDGERILTAPMASVTYEEIVKAMVGRPIEMFSRDIHGDHRYAEPETNRGPQGAPGLATSSGKSGTPRLAITHLTSRGKFEDVNLEVHAGEIVGLAGLLGAGRTELARAVFGRDKFDSGSVSVDGEARHIRSPRDGLEAGIILVPEERKSQGLVLGRAIETNITMAHPEVISKVGWLDLARARNVAKDLIDRLSIKASGPDTVVGTLSGGNQQKVVIGRCFLTAFKVYIFDEPTRGVDINAKSQIYHLINDLTRRGAGVLMISSELPELIAVADRVLVMREGRITAELHRGAATEEAILSAAMA